MSLEEIARCSQPAAGHLSQLDRRAMNDGSIRQSTRLVSFAGDRAMLRSITTVLTLALMGITVNAADKPEARSAGNSTGSGCCPRTDSPAVIRRSRPRQPRTMSTSYGFTTRTPAS